MKNFSSTSVERVAVPLLPFALAKIPGGFGGLKVGPCQAVCQKRHECWRPDATTLECRR